MFIAWRDQVNKHLEVVDSTGLYVMYLEKDCQCFKCNRLDLTHLYKESPAFGTVYGYQRDFHKEKNEINFKVNWFRLLLTLIRKSVIMTVFTDAHQKVRINLDNEQLDMIKLNDTECQQSNKGFCRREN